MSVERVVLREPVRRRHRRLPCPGSRRAIDEKRPEAVRDSLQRAERWVETVVESARRGRQRDVGQFDDERTDESVVGGCRRFLVLDEVAGRKRLRREEERQDFVGRSVLRLRHARAEREHDREQADPSAHPAGPGRPWRSRRRR